MGNTVVGWFLGWWLGKCCSLFAQLWVIKRNRAFGIIWVCLCDFCDEILSAKGYVSYLFEFLVSFGPLSVPRWLWTCADAEWLVGGHTAAHLTHFQPFWPAAQPATPLPSRRPCRRCTKQLRMLIAQIILVGTQLVRLTQLLAGGIQQIVVIDMANTRVPFGRQIGQKGEARAGRLGGLQGGFLAGHTATPQGGLIRVAGRYHLQLGAILIVGGRIHWHWD